MGEVKMDRRRIRKIYGKWPSDLKGKVSFKNFLREYGRKDGYAYGPEFRQYMERKGMKVQA